MWHRKALNWIRACFFGRVDCPAERENQRPLRPERSAPLSGATTQTTPLAYLYKCNVAKNNSELDQSCSIGRVDWIRTSDPYVPNVVRYRAAPLPALIILYQVSILQS